MPSSSFEHPKNTIVSCQKPLLLYIHLIPDHLRTARKTFA